MGGKLGERIGFPFNPPKPNSSEQMDLGFEGLKLRV